MAILEEPPTEANFHVWTVESEATVTIHVEGELDMATASQLAAELAAHAGGPEVVIDLAACTFIDSSGVTELLKCRQQLDRGSIMRVVEAAPNVARTLQLCGLLTILDVAHQ